MEVILWGFPAKVRKQSPEPQGCGFAAVEIAGSYPASNSRFWNAVGPKLKGPRPLQVNQPNRGLLRITNIIEIVCPDFPFCSGNLSRVGRCYVQCFGGFKEVWRNPFLSRRGNDLTLKNGRKRDNILGDWVFTDTTSLRFPRKFWSVHDAMDERGEGI